MSSVVRFYYLLLKNIAGFLKGCLLPGSLIAKHISVLRQPYSSKSEKKPQLSYTLFLYEPSVGGEAGTDDLDWPVVAVGA